MAKGERIAVASRKILDWTRDFLMASSFSLLMPGMASSRSGSSSNTWRVAAPKAEKIFSAVLGPMPLICPEDRYPTIPSLVGATTSR